MNCSKVNNLISAYIDGELTGDEQILVRRHLRDCTTCTEEYESLMATKRLIASFAARLPDSSLETKILSALNEMPDCQTWRDSVRSWWGSLPELQKLKTAGALAFASVSIALMMFSVTRPRQTPQDGLARVTGSSASIVDSDSKVDQGIGFVRDPVNNGPAMGSTEPVAYEPIPQASPKLRGTLPVSSLR